MSTRKANGQVRQTQTTISEKKLLSPISQNGRSPASARWSWSTRMWLTRPESRWSMKLQVITPA
jgi:hypothetical protein